MFLRASQLSWGGSAGGTKLRDARYRPGSRPEWLKIKAPGWTAQNWDRWEKLRGW